MSTTTIYTIQIILSITSRTLTKHYQYYNVTSFKETELLVNSAAWSCLFRRMYYLGIGYKRLMMKSNIHVQITEDAKHTL